MPNFSGTLVKICCNFATVLLPKSAFGWDRGSEPIYRKGVLDALCLTFRNLAVPQTYVKHKSNKDVPIGVYKSDTSMLDSHCWLLLQRCMFIYLCVGFGVVSFRHTGDARASERETSNMGLSRIFCIYEPTIINHQS